MVATPSIRTTSPSESLSEYLRAERYEALIRVSQAIGAHRDPKDLFSAMATEMHRVVQFDGIAVTRKHSDAYCEEEVRFLSLVADQVALAIDDALNFEASQSAQTALQRKNDRLKLLLEVNNTIVSNLELRDLLRAISASIRSVMQCDGVGVALADREGKHLQVYAFDFPSNDGQILEGLLIGTNEDSPTRSA